MELLRMALAMVQRSAAGCDALGADGDGVFRELANKVEAFQQFRQAEPGDPSRDPYQALWSFEGLGYAHAERAWTGPRPPRGLLVAPGVPRHLQIPFHTGMGLCFATRLLTLWREPRAAGWRGALEGVLDLCAANASPGLEEAAREALGLAVRNLHPDLMTATDRQLREIGEERVGSFWHGVGRGLYFSPTRAVPSRESWAWALAEARSEPPDELGQWNAVAGLVWAMTLVNLRHPRILEGFLRGHVDRLPAGRRARGSLGGPGLVRRPGDGPGSRRIP